MQSCAIARKSDEVPHGSPESLPLTHGHGSVWRTPYAQIFKQIEQTILTELDGHHIGINPDGSLDFSRSTISDRAAQNSVRGIYQDIRSWGTKPGDLTPAAVDVLKRRIADVYSPTSNARAFTQAVKDSTHKTLVKQVPGYEDMTKGYASASEFLDQLSKLWPRGLAGPSTGASIFASIMGGFLSPKAALAIVMASPRLMGELMVAMSKTKPVVSAAGQMAGQTPAVPLAAENYPSPQNEEPVLAQNR